jgi:hypothetical protein
MQIDLTVEQEDAIAIQYLKDAHKITADKKLQKAIRKVLRFGLSSTAYDEWIVEPVNPDTEDLTLVKPAA